MKKLVLFLILLLPLRAVAQAIDPQIAAVAAHLQTERISLHYQCVLTQDTPVHLSGTLLIQGECYRAVGNGLEIYSDGISRWTVDRESKEVYIEAAAGLEELRSYRDAMTSLSLTEVRYSPLSDDLSAFRFDTAALDPEQWVVTDLR